MANQDPGTWANVGIALGGALTGLAGAFGFRRRFRTVSDDKVRREIRELQDTVLNMKKDLENMHDHALRQMEAIERLEGKTDIVIAEIFRELKAIALSLKEVTTIVSISMKGHHE